MAKIFPQYVPDNERRAKPERRAEFLLYDHLNEQLGDEWLVLYGQAIKWTDAHGVHDREADFIVAHPNLGVVMIEVKGGSISRNGGLWYSTPLSQLDRPEHQRTRHNIRDPYDQATNAAKSYERKLDDYVKNQRGPRDQRLPPRKFKIGTAVCFPDIEIPAGYHLAGDALPECTLSRGDLTDLKQRIFEIYKASQGKTGEPPGEEGLTLLTRVLARSWNIKSFISYQYEDTEKQFKKLTEEQFNLIYSVQNNRKMLVSGCAGSGKTMLAAEMARRFAAQGEDVLFVCYNERLADWLQSSPFARDNIKFVHFHGLCEWAADRFGIDIPDYQEIRRDINQKNEYFELELPLALIQAVELGGDNIRFDSILVDEGQDFMSDWLTLLLEHLLRDEDTGRFYVFYDNNQRIYSRGGKPPFDWFDYYLSQNKRNTNQIFDELKKFYFQPNAMLPSNVSGPIVSVFPAYGPEETYNKLEIILDNLINEKFKLDDIILLTSRTRSDSIWQQKPQKSRKYFPVWDLRLTGQKFSCSSIYHFKGLERPIVILSELEHVSDNRQAVEILYVAISRARYQLIILGEVPPIFNG